MQPRRLLRVDRVGTDCFLMPIFAPVEKCAESVAGDTATVDRVHVRSAPEAGGLAQWTGRCSITFEGSTRAKKQSFRTHSFRTQNLQGHVSHFSVLFCQLPRVSISGAVDMLEL